MQVDDKVEDKFLLNPYSAAVIADLSLILIPTNCNKVETEIDHSQWSKLSFKHGLFLTHSFWIRKVGGSSKEDEKHK